MCQASTCRPSGSAMVVTNKRRQPPMEHTSNLKPGQAFIFDGITYMHADKGCAAGIMNSCHSAYTLALILSGPRMGELAHFSGTKVELTEVTIETRAL